MTKQKISIQSMSEMALFTALLAILSQIAIPLPNGVPVTLQTFGVALAGYYLGPKKGGGAIAIYILLGSIGIPVFSNFKAGFAAIFGVTGGFLWGFILMAICAGTGREKKASKAVFGGFVGLLLCHLLGTLQFSALTGNPYAASFLMVSMPFIPKDAASVVFAYYFARMLQKRRFSL